ncbi:putative fluoride ion transporter CrcB 2 [Acrocarpospora corrugata]|uniref:Fluoride-specific ion channel FluC n=1 Tax=Acrocarpospora corrugata TaxID=35763 RepID=A0A5M3W237_9ACTN|nr:fluoride efflux transporter CrcB [Acrocarpospora corrugata]GES01201.1 putative fluoride ion transporter CrcB 2 [Acrocarpospora corrugata]
MTVLLVALGAAIGAPLRYLTDRFIQARHDSVFPWGTMAVNVAGSFVLGLLVGLPVPESVAVFAGTGFCGALTTYSTFSYETVRLTQEGSRFYAVANVTASVTAGLGAATLGLVIGQAIGSLVKV